MTTAISAIVTARERGLRRGNASVPAAALLVFLAAAAGARVVAANFDMPCQR
jgi:hypothetical protein